jgi:hypothetical protein
MSTIPVAGSRIMTLKRWANTAPTSKLGMAKKIMFAPRASVTREVKTIKRSHGHKFSSNPLITGEGAQFVFTCWITAHLDPRIASDSLSTTLGEIELGKGLQRGAGG